MRIETTYSKKSQGGDSEMTSRHELDTVDRKILRILGTDGRASYQAIADEVGLSRPAVMERVKRLEESGHIAGYHAGVLECHHVAGEDCYILKVAAPDLESLQGILRDLRGPAAKTQMSTRTTIVLGTVFEKPGFVPVELD